MPRQLHKLTAKKVAGARSKPKPYTLADGGGLVLLVKPDGGRFWRYRYRHRGLAKMISFGDAREVSLADARSKLTDARKLVAAGVDPSAKRRAERSSQSSDSESFKAVAEEFLASQRATARQTIDTGRRRLELYIYPKLGRTAVGSVTAPDLLDALRRIEKRGTHETAHRVRALCGRVFRYAIATGRATRDVAADLRGALGAVQYGSFAAITDAKQFGELLAAIEHYNGQPVTRIALQLLALTFVRPGELRLATWDEFTLDGENPQWLLPAERTKKKRQHLVPLSSRAVELLREAKQYRRDDGEDHVFPSLRRGRPISEGTLNVALRNIGYDGTTHVPHGFRKTASTLLRALKFDVDVIEFQLAHLVGNRTERAYNYYEYIDERRAMMKRWADYLDELVLVG
jgi:integrase